MWHGRSLCRRFALKIAVIGPGAMGLFFAVSLQEAGQKVWVLDYRPERAVYLAQSGVRLITLLGEERQYLLNFTHDAATIGPCELALVNVKAHQTHNAVQHLPVLLESGGSNLESMAEVVGPQRLLAGVTMLGVTKLDVNRIRHAGHGKIILGRPPASQVTTREIAAVVDIFQQAGLDCQATSDIISVLWNKLLINVGINPVTALTRLNNGKLPAVPEVWQVVSAAVQEAYAVAEARGIALAAEPLRQVEEVCFATAGNFSSMLQDVLAQRRTEIDAINGQIVIHGQHLLIPTPINLCLTNLVKGLEAGF
jgi:2-dehydropantoate 2-reductase